MGKVIEKCPYIWKQFICLEKRFQNIVKLRSIINEQKICGAFTKKTNAYCLDKAFA